MNQFYAYIVFILQMFSQMFCTIDRTVLPARTAEGHLQVGKTSFEETLHMVVYQFIHRIQDLCPNQG